MFDRGPAFDFAPYRLSGAVYGVLLNDRAALAALGDAVNQPPYKAPPRAPLLYIKPRNTLAASGASVPLAAGDQTFEVGVALAMVIGRTACRVSAAAAPDHVAGYVLVADLSVPHRAYYRPSVRYKARDDSCLLGPRVVPRSALADPAAVELRLSIDGVPVQRATAADMQRPAAQLLADVSAFMTLAPGDVLLLGVAAGAPEVRIGQRFAVEADRLGCLEGCVVGAAA